MEYCSYIRLKKLKEEKYGKKEKINGEKRKNNGESGRDENCDKSGGKNGDKNRGMRMEGWGWRGKDGVEDSSKI